MTRKQRLLELLADRSVTLGDFTLASGARSSYYVDARRTTMTAEGQALVGEVCFETLVDVGLDPSHIGGLTLGADPITYAVAHHSYLKGRPIDGFTVRKAAKAHGTGQRIEGGLPSDAKVVLVEDSITSGGSALQALEVVEEHGCDILAVLALVDRNEGGRQRLEEAGYTLHTVFDAQVLVEKRKERASQAI